MARPKISNDPLYRLIREGDVEGFNRQKGQGKHCDLRHCDFRGLDLREFDFASVDLSGAYFRGADLRGLDLSSAILENASLADAKISGTLFPKALSADEIRLSVEYGTRMRYFTKS